MSVFFVVIPIIAAWPIFTAAAAAAAGALGYTIHKATREEVDLSHTAQIKVENSQALGEALGRQGGLELRQEKTTIRVERDARGQCRISVCNPTKGGEELKKIGYDFLHRLTQQYAYGKVMEEVKKSGFTVTQEKVSEDKTIKITVRKWV